MVNQICNGCVHLNEFFDPNRVRRYRCEVTGAYVRPSDTCEFWANKIPELKENEEPEKTTVRVWNPRSKRHEDVKA